MATIERHKAGRRFLLKALLLGLLIATISCGGHSHTSTVPLLTITVGSPVLDTIGFKGFNAYAANVTPGSLYKISVTGVTDDVDLNVYGTDSTFTAPLICPVDNAVRIGIVPEDCIIAATDSIIYFGVDATFIAASAASYTIDIELVQIAAGARQIPLPDNTTTRTARAYAVPVTPGVNYTVSVTGLNDDVDLYVFGNDASFSAQAV